MASAVTIDHTTATVVITQAHIEQSTDDLANLSDGRNKPLIIVLAVTLPTLAVIGIVILLIICYRRRNATLCFTKFEHSNRLQPIVVNLAPNSNPSDYSERKPRLPPRQFIAPYTETIVYNRLSTPSTPVFNTSFNRLPSSNEGETNEAFDEYLIKNEQEPVLRAALQKTSNEGQQITSLQSDFPGSLQTPVHTITPALLQVIALHRMSLLMNANNVSSSSLETATTSTNPIKRHSGSSSSCSNSSQTVLLFSQRTEL